MTEFSYQRDTTVAGKHAARVNERLDFFVHDLRNVLQRASPAFETAKAGTLSLSDATGAVLDRALDNLHKLIDVSLAEVLSASGNERPPDVFSLVDFIGEIKQSVALRARAHGCALTVSGVDSRLAIRANRDLLFSALENMLRNSALLQKAIAAGGDVYAQRSRGLPLLTWEGTA